MIKGTLHKTEQGWVVKHSRLNDDGEQIGFGRYEQLLLHPAYVKYYLLDEDAEGCEVYFEIENFWGGGIEMPFRVAKLFKQEYPEIEGTLALTNDVIWTRIYDEYSKEQYPPFGGPFTDSLSFIDWLKQNYKAPTNTKEIDPYISDDFQIGPDGAYEHTEQEETTWDDLFNDVESKLDIYIPIRAINYIRNKYQNPQKK
jgi:hypothetical protein